MWSGDEQKMKETHEKEHMSVAKVVELIGSSPDGWEAAAANAVEAAAQTLRNIKGIDVTRWTAKVEKNKIVEYRAVVKIAFIVERE
jgi:dodecin